MGKVKNLCISNVDVDRLENTNIGITNVDEVEDLSTNQVIVDKVKNLSISKVDTDKASIVDVNKAENLGIANVNGDNYLYINKQQDKQGTASNTTYAFLFFLYRTLFLELIFPNLRPLAFF